MSQSRPWFRMYGEVLDDRKLAWVAKSTGQPRALILGVWTGLLALANESPRRGWLLLTETVALDDAAIAEAIGIDQGVLLNIYTAFRAMDMITYSPDGKALVISHWDARQFESDSSTERVREYRKRQGNDGGGKLQQRDGNVSVTPSETESESESETESETESEAQKTAPRPPALDPLAHMVKVATEGLGNAGTADPSQSDDPWQYHNEALEIFSQNGGQFTGNAAAREVQRGAILALASEQDFHPPRWKSSVQTCILGKVQGGNVQCMIDTYHFGGNYQAMRAAQKGANGNVGKSNGSHSGRVPARNPEYKVAKASDFDPVVGDGANAHGP